MFWSKPKPVLFEHVPKCGGVSITKYLASNFPSDKSFLIDGSKKAASLQEFKAIPSEKKAQLRFVAGHGAHELWPYVSSDFVGFTILRDPVDRIISHYHFVLASPSHYLHAQVMAAKMSLRDYASSGISGELTNNYTCRFLGVDHASVTAEPEKFAQQAFQLLLTRYKVIGTLDKLDDAMLQLKKSASLPKRWQNIRLNKTKSRLAAEEISTPDREAIEAVNQADLELYRLISSIRN